MYKLFVFIFNKQCCDCHYYYIRTIPIPHNKCLDIKVVGEISKKNTLALVNFSYNINNWSFSIASILPPPRQTRHTASGSQPDIADGFQLSVLWRLDLFVNLWTALWVRVRLNWSPNALDFIAIDYFLKHPEITIRFWDKYCPFYANDHRHRPRI